MKTRNVLSTVVIVLRIQCAVCVIDPISIATAAAAAVASFGSLYAGYANYYYCKINECCDDNWIPNDVNELNAVLTKQLHGQQVAHTTIIHALRGYAATNKHPKALALSFHGLPGTGKNFAARHIASSFYKNGINSQYYNFFSGRSFAHTDSRISDYKLSILNTITEGLSKCEKSMFVFDEVDMMPEGLLNVLVQFLDYVPQTTVLIESERKTVTTNKAIFIFLSNTGSKQIMEQMLNFWTYGKSRDLTTLEDFEHLISIGAFNEKGGFHKSDTIETSLIDYYVPFLPLAEEHVRLCMKDAFRDRGVKPTLEMEEKVLSVITYGPEPFNVFSASGCKRIEQKVISLSHLYHKNKIN